MEQSQARSENKLNFHLNSTLTSLNLARKSHWLSIPKEQRSAFLKADIKTLHHNKILIERFIDVSPINPNTRKNQNIFKELINLGINQVNYGALAA